MGDARTGTLEERSAPVFLFCFLLSMLVTRTKRRLCTASLDAAAAGSLPLLAIVGAPNAGKSTLYNRLVRTELSARSFRPRALVAPTAGTTRDRMEGESEWLGYRFRVVDTGGIEDLWPLRQQADSGRRGAGRRQQRRAPHGEEVARGDGEAASPPPPGGWQLSEVEAAAAQRRLAAAVEAQVAVAVKEAAVARKALPRQACVPRRPFQTACTSGVSAGAAAGGCKGGRRRGGGAARLAAAAAEVRHFRDTSETLPRHFRLTGRDALCLVRPTE